MAIELTGRDMMEGRRNLDILRAIPEHAQHAKIRVAGKAVTVDMQTARVLSFVHDALNDENQAKYQGMLARSPATFQRIVNFAWANVR